MREIRFRGKDIKTGEWRYGSYIMLREPDDDIHSDCAYKVVHYIYALDEVCGTGHWYEIDKNTVGQFTGRIDNYFHDLYEGDIVFNDDDDEKCLVVYDRKNAMFGLEYPHAHDDGIIYGLYNVKDKEISIIGNKYDNPELVEEIMNVK